MKTLNARFAMKPLTFATFVLTLLSAVAVANVVQDVDELIPGLGAEKVEDRYAPQMKLQALALNAARPGAEAERVQLAKILAARVTDPFVSQPARVWLVRQLEYIGGAESVKTLTLLLESSDAELRDCARRALERNPAPAATKSLRAVLKHGGSASWELGLIHSLGERKDEGSVSLIAKYVMSPELGPTATLALARIGTKGALKELWPAVGRGNEDAVEALIVAANRLVAEGRNQEAIEICHRLLAIPKEERWRAAVLAPLAKAEPQIAERLIDDSLASPEPKLQGAAVTTAKEIWGENAPAFLFRFWPRLDSSAKVLVLAAADSSVEPQVLAATEESDPLVQAAALEALQRAGTSSSLPVLLRIAAEKSSLSSKAVLVLGRLSGPGINQTLMQFAGKGEIPVRCAAIEALGERNAPGFIPDLLKYVQQSDVAVRNSACSALGKLGTDAELKTLTRLALEGTTPKAESAARRLASRSKRKSSAAGTLLVLANSTPPEQLPTLFGILGAVGGSNALQVVVNATTSSNTNISDAAVHTLADWPDFSATRPLLELAANADTSQVNNVLALQGIVRLLGNDSDEQLTPERIDVALAALQAARRDDEKKQVLSTFGSLPDKKTAEAIKPLLDTPALRTEAALAGISMGGRLLKTNKAEAKSLASAIKQAQISEELTAKADKILGGEETKTQ
jgi:HEAT repeat protein